MALATASIAANPLQYLANLIASSATFRDVVGADGVSEALRFVHWPEADERPDDDSGLPRHPRPRAVIRLMPQHDYERHGCGEWRDGGVLAMEFQFVVPELYRDDPKDAYTWFANTYGDIVDEMRANRDTGSASTPYLSVTEFVSVEGPDYPDPDDEQELGAYDVTYFVFWGIVRP